MPAPHIALGIGLVAVRIGVAGGIEPTHSHALAVTGRDEKAVDDLLIRFGGSVLQEVVDFFGCRRHPGQVQGDTADERCAVRFGGSGETFPLETLQDEMVDSVDRPTRDRRQARPLGWRKRPMRLPLGALLDPAAHQIDFAVAQLGVAFVGRGHAADRIFGRQPLDDFTFPDVPGDDG